MIVSSSYVKLDSVEDSFLKEGWAQDCVEGDVIRAETESRSDTWKALQIWGFAEIDGQRKHVRRVLATKGKEEIRIRLVYDWQG